MDQIQTGITPTKVLQRLEVNLQEACVAVEAGFYFEEGGCFGMALAIREALASFGLSGGLAYSDSIEHAVVELEGQHYDYTGKCQTPEGLKAYTEDAFITKAAQCGKVGDSLVSDILWAREAVTLALEADY